MLTFVFSLYFISSFPPSVHKMHFQIGLATALTAAGALAVPVSTDASNSTSPCGIITQQINEFYSDKSSMAHFDISVSLC